MHNRNLFKPCETTTAMSTEKTKETEKNSPAWVKMSKEEIEKEILSLAKEGNTPAKIGLILRDKHAIPKVKTIIGKGIAELLTEKKVEFKTEKNVTEEKVKYLESHVGKNKHDRQAAKALTKHLWMKRH